MIHTQKKCKYPMRGDLVLQILLMCTQQESIHFLHLKQHRYIGILEWISEEFSCLLTTITYFRKISLLLFCESIYKILYKTDFMIIQYFNFIIRISYSMKHIFIILCCDYIDSEQSSGQIICIKIVRTPYVINGCCLTEELNTEFFAHLYCNCSNV